MDVGAWEDKLRASLEAKTAKLAEALRRSAQRKGGYCNTGDLYGGWRMFGRRATWQLGGR